MFKERGVEYTYREYTEEPLSRAELDEVFAKLKLAPKDLLRSREAKAAGLTGDEAPDVLLDHMAESPTLLQRPILVSGDRAVVGRPLENLEGLL